MVDGINIGERTFTLRELGRRRRDVLFHSGLLLHATAYSLPLSGSERDHLITSKAAWCSVRVIGTLAGVMVMKGSTETHTRGHPTCIRDQ